MSGADLITTAIGATRGDRESNPILTRADRVNWPSAIGLNAGACGTLILLRHAHPGRLGRVLMLIGVGARSAIVAHNLEVLKRSTAK